MLIENTVLRIVLSRAALARWYVLLVPHPGSFVSILFHLLD